MNDPRFEKTTLFARRKFEWTDEKIKQYVDSIMKNVELLNGWTYCGSSWIDEVAHPDETKTKKPRKEELKKSLFKLLKITITAPENKEYVYQLQIPELVDDQFFYVNGFLKIPIFQLYDMPIIYRETYNGTMLKLRLNSITVQVDLDRKDGIPMCQIFSRDIPLHELIAAFHTKEELDNFVFQHEQCLENETLKCIYMKAVEIYNLNLNKQQICERVGEYYSTANTDKFKRGNVVLFSLNAAYNVDIFSKKFFHTESLLFELLYAIYKGPRSDKDLKEKRLRFSEYILYPLVYRMYDMLVTMYKNRKNKFQIPQNLILENCNASDQKDSKNTVSHIIHYNIPTNPVSEIAGICQCTLVGPGGFKKDTVPLHLRNIDDSHFGFICPTDTPDRDGCGVVLNLTPVADIDENGKFGKPAEELITSYPVSLIPFMMNDDATRLQMASSQLKQAILLRNSQKPWIKSGVEGCYIENTTFLYKAKYDGIVIYKDRSFMIISYPKSEENSNSFLDVLNINYRTTGSNNIDYIYTSLKEGDEFKKNDILCQSYFLKDSELSLGQNLLTEIIIYKGLNYEDGITISETASKKMESLHLIDLSFTLDQNQILLSLNNDDYIPIPKIGDILKKGQTYAKLKSLDSESGYENINDDPVEFKSTHDCKIISIEIYPNVWNHKIHEFNDFMKSLVGEQVGRYNKIISTIESYMTPSELNKFVTVNGLSTLNCDVPSRKGKQGYFSIKGQRIPGVYFKIRAVYKEKIEVGDKIANRHGNKGIISKVLPDEKMPILPDGRRVEVILNPLGIISRMNVGQLYEVHYGEILYHLRNKLRNISDEEQSLILNSVFDLIDKTETKWIKTSTIDKFFNDKKEKDIEYALSELSFTMPVFKNPIYQEMFALLDMLNVQEKVRVFDPDMNIEFNNEIYNGYMYFEKLIHRSSEKVSARSIGPYNKKTSQPLGGRKNQGGHRLGEMEVWALFAHDANSFSEDLLTAHSDSIGRKNKIISEMLQNPSLVEDDTDDEKPQSLRIMESYLNAVGLSMESSENSQLFKYINLLESQQQTN